MAKVFGGYTFYGIKIGVLMLDTTFPRIEGDVGNAKSFPFPVLYHVVKGVPNDKVVLDLTMEDIKPFIEGAKYLEQMGVKAITTSCGFLSLFQNEIANAVKIPVFTSALTLLPVIHRLIGGRGVLILTANSSTLRNQYFEAATGESISDKDYVIGTQEKKVFTNFTIHNWQEVEVDEMRKDLFEVVSEGLSVMEDCGAILFECTNMSPFREEIKNKFNLPVFDIVTMMEYIEKVLPD